MSIPAKSDDSVEIREVWVDNLDAKMAVIREIVDEYPLVAMDPELPGIAITPIRIFKNKVDENYQMLCTNVDLLNLFPTVYYIKHLIKFCNSLYGGHDNVAEQLDAKQIGVSHLAGSDSLLTARVFWRLKDKYFHGSIDRYAGSMYGLES